MVGNNELNIGDIVFARVRGFPFWPARIFSIDTGVKITKFKVVFYGTYEEAFLKANDLLPFTNEKKEEFSKKYNKRIGYLKGLEEVENTPDIIYGFMGPNLCPVEDSEEEVGVAELGTPKNSKRSSKECRPTPTANVSKELPTKFSPTPTGNTIPKSETVEKEAVIADGSPPKSVNLEKTIKKEKTRRKLKPKHKLGSDGLVMGFMAGTDDDVESDKTREVDVTEQRSIYARVKQTGDLVLLPLDKDMPVKFDSEEQKLEWEMSAARKALKLKKQIEDGSKVPVTNKTKEGEKINAEIKKKAAYLAEKKNILKYLLLEKDLENLAVSIKKALHLESPDPHRCIESLEELLEAPVTPLILKKHSHIVQLIKKLRKYAGPVGMASKDEISRFIPVINQKAEEIFEKFKIVFNYAEKDSDDGQGFLEEYSRQVTEFDKKTSHMEDMDIAALITDPTKQGDTSSQN